MKIIRILKEFKNYFFLKKTIQKNKTTEKWKKLNLREGYLGIIWTVVNLPPEVYESEEQYYQMYVIEQLKPVNEYLESLNLQEIVTLSVENKCDPENGVYAFGVRYIPLFREFTLWWMFKWSILLLVTWWLQAKFDVFSYLTHGLNWLINIIKP